MKPAFALSFSATEITVHHQSDDDWYCIGEVALDAPDLSDQLRTLRDNAFALENNLSCKVVIPTDQVRFLTAEVGDQSPEESALHAQDTLADATPYSVEELVFDTVTVGTSTYVAAVTQQTLNEAKDFAAQHGFIPVQVTAEPDPQSFPSEPNFTATETHTAITGAATAHTPEKPDGPGPNVHPIADETAPDVFQSVPSSKPRAVASASVSPVAKRYAIPAAIAATVLIAAFGTWSLTGSNDLGTPEPENAQLTPETQIGTDPATVSQSQSPQTVGVKPQIATPEPVAPSENSQQDLTSTDAAILEALNIAPTVVEQVQRDSPALEIPAQPGLEITAPEPLISPDLATPDDLYLTSIDNSNLSTDAIALPPVESFATDEPFVQIALPSSDTAQFDLDERGLVTPTPEGTLNPDGITVYLGQPSKVPPEPPVRFEQEPTLEEEPDRLAQIRPKPRPGDLIERFERRQLGGRTREELAGLRPKLRPESIQQRQVDDTPTALAVVRVPRPKLRPAGLAPSSGTQTANLGSTAAVDQPEAGSFQPKAVAPKIPSSASVARQATIDNALNLRKLNLIGVYGTPANRRALVRLPSGRYKKLKVGDRLDGGRVIAIGDSELRYQKKGRNLTLKMPRS